MLVLKRKLSELIRIGDDIVIQLVSLESGAARIGIQAPGSYRILREEVAQRDAAELAAATGVASVVPAAGVELTARKSPLSRFRSKAG